MVDGWPEVIEENKNSGWLIPRTEVKFIALLGRSGPREVYTATYKSRRVCVRALAGKGLASATDKDLCSRFAEELRVSQKCKSNFTCQLLGVVCEGPERAWFVSEYLYGGNLNLWIHGRPNMQRGARLASLGNTLHTFEENVRMCLGIAMGMKVLESQSPQIVHRNLRPSNICLDSNKVPKICNYGISEASYDDRPSRAKYSKDMDRKYTAPEVLGNRPHDSRSDVWSWAIIFIEIFSGKKPYDRPSDLAQPPHGWVFMTDRPVVCPQLPREVMRTKPPERADSSGLPTDPGWGSRFSRERVPFPPVLLRLMQQCLKSDPIFRPTFSTIVNCLQNNFGPIDFDHGP